MLTLKCINNDFAVLQAPWGVEDDQSDVAINWDEKWDYADLLVQFGIADNRHEANAGIILFCSSLEKDHFLTPEIK